MDLDQPPVVRVSADPERPLPSGEWPASIPAVAQLLRNQLGGMLGQSPWALMNQLTERNLQFWNELQQNMAGNGSPSAAKDKTGAKRR